MTTGNQPGFFMTLEGIEGAGKSTHARFIEEKLREQGRECQVTREPGGTKLGEHIRNILLQEENLSISPESELLLMFAARAQHIETIIRPALQAGKVVICDRFSDSSYAYQGGGRGVPSGNIDRLVDIVHPALTPDLTLLFDLSPETGLARAVETRDADRFETEDVAFFEAARRVFLDRATSESHRFRVINADGNVEAVQAEIVPVLQEFQLC